MAKGRHLKPDFFTDKHIVSVSPLARLLYQGLWCYAFDCGHIDDEPIEFKMRILPADSCDVEELLGELLKVGRIQRADGVIYLPTLTKHGRIDKRYETACDACKDAREGKPIPKGSRSVHDGDTTGTRRDEATTPRDREANTQVMVMVNDGDGDVERTSAPRAKRATTKGTRIPDSFNVTDAMRKWADDEGWGWVDLDLLTESFIDYWRSAAGSKGVKLDWVATWRNWVRTDVVNGKAPRRSAEPPLSSRIGQSIALLPKCPTCNAPQEITHYEMCPDQEWRPSA